MSRAQVDQAWRYATEPLPKSGRYCLTVSTALPDGKALVAVYRRTVPVTLVHRFHGDLVTGLRMAGDLLRELDARAT